MNYGYKPTIELGKDWVFQGANGLLGSSTPIIKENGQWDIVEYEEQVGLYFDTFSCVTFGTLNAVEMILKAKGIEENFSDRYLASKSDTSCSWGNYVHHVANTLRLHGTPKEVYYTWERRKNPPEIVSCSEYLKPVTEELDHLAKINFLDKYTLNWTWSKRTIEDRKEALKYSPVGIGVYAWEAPIDGIHYNSNNPSNHWVVCYGYEEGRYWKIYDSYGGGFKKLDWNYFFGAEALYFINIKSINNNTMLPERLQNGTFLVQNTQGDGSFAVLIDSKMYVDQLDKILATYLVRGGTNGGGLTKEVWDSLEKYNLKNEKVS